MSMHKIHVNIFVQVRVLDTPQCVQWMRSSMCSITKLQYCTFSIHIMDVMNILYAKILPTRICTVP